MTYGMVTYCRDGWYEGEESEDSRTNFTMENLQSCYLRQASNLPDKERKTLLSA